MSFKCVNFWLIVLPCLLLVACGNSTDKSNMITVSIEGSGAVVSNDEAIDCGDKCSAVYYSNELFESDYLRKTIELTAIPNENQRFYGWSGCPQANHEVCTIDVRANSGDLEVKAIFESLAVNLYDLTFESPDHMVGQPPHFGPGPKLVPQNYAIGTIYEQFSPKVVEDGKLPGKILLFQPQLNATGTYSTVDALTLALGHNADIYTMETDMIISYLDTNSPFIIFTDKSSQSNALTFYDSGVAKFDGVPLFNFNFGVKFHICLEINFQDRVTKIYYNDIFIKNIDFSIDSTLDDVNDFRFYSGFSLLNRIEMDNIRIDALLNTQLPQPEPLSGGTYLIDFDHPPLSSYGPKPYHEDGFNITYPAMRSIGGIPTPSVPFNGTTNVAFASSCWPLIYHKYGYEFNLLSIDTAGYNNGISISDFIVIHGITSDGKTISRTINWNYLYLNFETVYFDETWKNLRYIYFTDGVFSADNIVIQLTNNRIGLLPAIRN